MKTYLIQYLSTDEYQMAEYALQNHADTIIAQDADALTMTLTETGLVQAGCIGRKLTGTTYQVTSAVHYHDEGERWHYGVTFFGTYAECRRELKELRHIVYKDEDWRRAGDTVGFRGQYATRCYRIEPAQPDVR